MVTDALRQALQVRRHAQDAWVAAGLIHHSDAGVAICVDSLHRRLIDAGIAGSIGTVGDALDYALCKSTIGLFKTEAINLTGPAWDRPTRRRMAGRPLGLGSD
jgi:putative transposase